MQNESLITIIKQQYEDHPMIEVIEDCLAKAIRGQSAIPEYSLNIDGMCGHFYRMFINNFARSIESPRYLEVGTYHGASLCSTIGGIEGIEAVACDNWGLEGNDIEVTKKNIQNVLVGENSRVGLITSDFDNFDFTKYGKFNIYMYDGDHSEHYQRIGITKAVPALEEISLVIVDDWNDGYQGEGSVVKKGTYAGFKEAGLEILYKFEVETGVNPYFPSPWHNGYGVFLVRKPASLNVAPAPSQFVIIGN